MKKRKQNKLARYALVIVAVILAIVASALAGLYFGRQQTSTDRTPEASVNQDALKFKAEYSSVSDNNRFVYKTPEQIIEILESGTGLVFFGFPECPWCQKYTVFLDEVSRQENLKEINYLNIREIRKNNTPQYQRIVELTKDYLDKDENGQPRVYVPDVVAVNEGKIIGHDNTSSLNTSADGTPDEWWTTERTGTVRNKLTSIIKDVKVCQSVCQE